MLPSRDREGAIARVALVLAFVVALPAGRGSVFRICLHAFHIYVAHPARNAPAGVPVQLIYAGSDGVWRAETEDKDANLCGDLIPVLGRVSERAAWRLRPPAGYDAQRHQRPGEHGARALPRRAVRRRGSLLPQDPGNRPEYSANPAQPRLGRVQERAFSRSGAAFPDGAETRPPKYAGTHPAGHELLRRPHVRRG